MIGLNDPQRHLVSWGAQGRKRPPPESIPTLFKLAQINAPGTFFPQQGNRKLLAFGFHIDNGLIHKLTNTVLIDDQRILQKDPLFENTGAMG